MKLQLRSRMLPLTAALCTVMLGACGAGGNEDTATVEPEPGLSPVARDTSNSFLVKIADQAELEQKIKKNYLRARPQQYQRPSALPVMLAAPLEAAGAANSASADSSDNYSSTYSVESGVAEADIIKYDGKQLYIALQYRHDNGAAFDSAALHNPALCDGADCPVFYSPAVKVLSASAEQQYTEPYGQIELPNNEYLDGLYLDDKQVLTLSTEQQFYAWGDSWIDAANWVSDNHITVRGFDKTQLQQQWQLQIDGALVQSRRIASTLYVVSRYTPQLPGISLYPASDEARLQNQQALNELELGQHLPQININGEQQNLFEANNCMALNDKADALIGQATLTTVTAIELNAPEQTRSYCIAAPASGVYISANSLYLTAPGLDWEKQQTSIHKFALAANSAEQSALNYRGSATVEGALWLHGNSEFRINEHKGVLRLLTSSWQQDENDWIDHHLHLLKEDTSQVQLNVIASLPNAEQPAEIGKANEDLYGVRFFGDRAYAVTFEQTDPLYVFDLSNAEQPRIAGELEIPGFNELLHPVNNSLLIGFGLEQNQLKLELFNVSDISAPQSLSKLFLGDGTHYEWSEASYQRHAFTYLAGEDSDRIAIPSRLYNSSSRASSAKLYMFELQNKNASAEAALLNELGHFRVDSDNQLWQPQAQRSVLHNNTVFFLSGDQVWTGSWGGVLVDDPN
ncbi:beta-propeller domain-containing protein [Agaribacterium haliotis]|uniref:beta-propeller domain-containing protein n=1 Tax=Agaribacterium haliotis TaxID=2013869 RepID=UPI0013043B08|nr:beta-propeller domain-containing protein [Agaribacterium haliotis]